jgi:cytochrome c2
MTSRATFLVLLVAIWISPAAADSLRGREIFMTYCQDCHGLTPEESDKRGPHLAGLLDRRYGAVEGFPYRMVWTEADPRWTEAQLDAYLEIHRLPEPDARADVIDFLVLATAGGRVVDPARGEALYNTQCSYCHALTKETARAETRANGEAEEISRALQRQPFEPHEPTPRQGGTVEGLRRGPHLAGLLARAPGAVSGFPYRFVYEISGPTWTEADLDSYIGFHARLGAFDRADLVAFLKTTGR